ncbi:MAG: YqgE/AlgH family protein [Sulfuriferula sp.]
MQTINLTGHFLIAMPSMADMRFSRTLTYICEHNEQGALGVIVNRPIEMKMAELFSQIGTTLISADRAQQPLYFGGPVETERGFVLHQPVGHWQSTLAVAGLLGLTTSRDILDAIGQGQGPDKLMVALGYAGWSAGQLESELGQNTWLSVAADAQVIFDLPAEERLEAAMHLLGVDYANLSEDAGHA